MCTCPCTEMVQVKEAEASVSIACRGSFTDTFRVVY